MKKRIVVTAAASVMLLSLGSITALAAENYSYLIGQERSESRIEAYVRAESFETDEEAEAYLASMGIGDSEYSEEAVQSYSYVGGRQRGASFSGKSDVTLPSSYSFTVGQQRSQSRNDVYAQAESIESEEEREAFLNEQEIGETEWSEDAVLSYSYVTGQQRGSSFRSGSENDNSYTDMSSYSYITGQQRGSGYHK
ncbi:MAG: hypothetical protein ACI3XR_10210 [Eubacteriales bacterium]